MVLGLVCAVIRSWVSEGIRDVGLWIAGPCDSGGFGGPVGVVLQLQGQVHVAHRRGLVVPTEQPGEEGRAPAVVGHLGTRGVRTELIAS